MDDAIRERATEAMATTRYSGYAADRLLDALDSAGLTLVDAAAFRALLDRCEERWSLVRGEGCYCRICGGARLCDRTAPIPHTADCPVPVLRASLPREEG